ncbi:MAG: hypothetical protein EOP84_33660, partial [Verrucomicrobiaceae bacterium]
MRVAVTIEPQAYRSTAIVLGLIGAVAGVLGILTGSSASIIMVAAGIGIVAIPALLALIFLSLLLHEIGHAIAALLMGLRVYSIKVYCVHFIFREMPFDEDDYAGAAYIEDTHERDRPIPATIVSLAGPAVDLSIVAYALMIGESLPVPWSTMLHVLGVSSAINAAASLFPREDQYSNDIGQIRDFWRPNSQLFAARALRRVWLVKDPKDIDQEDIRRALSYEDPLGKMYANQAAMFHAIGNDSLEAIQYAAVYAALAQNLLEKQVDEESARAYRIFLQNAHLEAAFAHAFLRRNYEAATTEMGKLKSIDKYQWPTMRRVWIAEALAQGDIEAANERSTQLV